MKENLEPTSADLLGGGDNLDQTGNAVNPNDEDIVVDAIDTTVPTVQDKEFVLSPGQLLGLDQAVLQSIDRCRKLLYIQNFHVVLIIFEL